jgi:hypothetical protein
MKDLSVVVIVLGIFLVLIFSAPAAGLKAAIPLNAMTITYEDGSKQVVGLNQTSDKILRMEFGCCDSPNEPLESPLHRYAGIWNSVEVGEMTLEIKGDYIVGFYSHDNGMISATLSKDGTYLEGTWSEEPTRQAPEDAGTIIMKLTNGDQTLECTYSYGDGPGGGTFSASKFK